jgi:hypothetical protein
MLGPIHLPYPRVSINFPYLQYWNALIYLWSHCWMRQIRMCFRIKLSDLLPINCKVVANSSWTIVPGTSKIRRFDRICLPVFCNIIIRKCLPLLPYYIFWSRTCIFMTNKLIPFYSNLTSSKRSDTNPIQQKINWNTLCFYLLLGIVYCSKKPCVNQGVCQDLITGYKCFCPNPYGGLRCEIGNDCNMSLLHNIL